MKHCVNDILAQLDNRVYNFSAGPAPIPHEVLQQARDEMMNWQEVGASVMEISHRSEQFLGVAHEAEKDFRELLQIPQNYKVLFCKGVPVASLLRFL